MATKKKAPSAVKSAKANLSGGGGQGGRSSDLKGGSGPVTSPKVEKPAASKKK